MATSTINFYKINFPSDTNCYIESIEDYLDTLEKLTFNDCQYIKNDLNINIKLTIDQDKINSFDNNYCKIKNSDETAIFYYFVRKLNWISSKVLSLDLEMDTVNTLAKNNVDCQPDRFEPTTEVLREHKDRFVRKGSWSSTTGGDLSRKIDKVSEGIVPNKYRQSDNKVQDTTGDFDWYLIYRSSTNDENSGIDTFLCASEPLCIDRQDGIATITWTYEDLEADKYYQFWDSDNLDWNILVNNPTSDTDYVFGAYKNINKDDEFQGSYEEINAGPYGIKNYKRGYGNAKSFVISLIDGNKILVEIQNNNLTVESVTSAGQAHYLKMPNSFKCDSIEFPNITRAIKSTHSTIEEEVAEETHTYVDFNTGLGHTTAISSIDSWLRSDSRILKILKLPYCPIEYNYTGQTGYKVYNFNSTLWQVDKHISGQPIIGFKYVGTGLPQFNLTSKLNLQLGELKYNIDSDNIKDNLLISENKDYCLGLESKIYHSDFYNVKTVYDTFNKQLNLENIECPETILSTSVPINYKVTSTINSNFGFKYEFSDSNVGAYISQEDFDKLLLVNANNTELITRNSYLDYVNNSMNYDKKMNALQVKYSIINSATNITSSAAQGAIGTSNPVSIGMGIVSGAVKSAISTAQTIESQNLGMEAKLAQLAAQSASTAGSDDSDLRQWYSENRLHIMRYVPQNNIREKIIHYLQWYGYSTESEYKTPVINTRIWYNYLQCRPELKNENTKMLKKEWVDEFKSKWEEGVTIFHKRNTNRYCLDRRYENYEKWILDE